MTGREATSVPGVAESHDARRARHQADVFYPDPAVGYSCLSDPRALYAYLLASNWTDLDGFPGQHRIVMFTGDHADHGADGEPTVVPDATGAVEMSWDQFTDRVLGGRVEMDPCYAPEMDPDGHGVSTFGMESVHTPLQEELVLMPFRLGLSDEPWWPQNDDED